MRRSRALLLMIAALGGAGCSGGADRTPGNDEPAAETPSAPRIVTVSVPSHLVVAPGETVRASLSVSIDPAHHVMANPASADYFVPLELELASLPDVEVGAVEYPEGIAFVVDGLDDPIETYEREIVLTVPVTAGAGAAPGPRTLGGILRYQGCSRHACLIPSSVPVALELRIGERP